MIRLSLPEQTLYADLVQRGLDTRFSEDFPENGSFTTVTRNGRSYWYYQGYRAGAEGTVAAKKWSKYVGPTDDPAISGRVQEFKTLRDAYRERRRLVSALLSMGLPRPDALTGDVVERLWKEGIFRLRAVLVGTAAFQTYAGLLGVRLPSAVVMTTDVDFAQFHSISVLVKDSLPPLLPVLRDVDATFREVPHSADPRAATAFVTAAGYRVEFLVPNRGSDDYGGRPAPMPALGGASAEPLRFLDFLIREPVHAALLHKAGVPVLVPQPERYAIHKLIVSVDRRNIPKSVKDLEQSSILFEALTTVGRAEDLGFSWIEAWERGEGWRRRLSRALDRLTATARGHLVEAIGVASRAEGRSPEDYGV